MVNHLANNLLQSNTGPKMNKKAAVMSNSDIQSGYRHKDGLIRYKGLKTTTKTKKSKEKQRKTKEILRS